MNLTVEEKKMLKVARVKCDRSLLFFARFFFKLLYGTKFIVNWHHEDICSALDSIGNYEHELLNINIPPRFSKTLLCIFFISRSLGRNHASNFLYITASDDLRHQTSILIRQIVTHPYFVYMYGLELRKDQNAKNLWRTTGGGGLKTSTIFGQITGFGAGQMIDRGSQQSIDDVIREFEGCIVLDDINKMDDSEVVSANNDKVTRVLFNTILSRKNSPDTPIINIQQRAGLEDATAKLTEHYDSDSRRHKMNNLVFPVINKEGEPLWEFQQPLDDIESMRNSPYTMRVFQTQYMQNPTPEEGGIFEREDFKIIKRKELPFNPDYVDNNFFIDGAYTDKTENDETATGNCYYDSKEGVLYVFNIEGVRKNLGDYLNWFKSYFRAQKGKRGSRVYVELKASGEPIKNMLRKPEFGNYSTLGIDNKIVRAGKTHRAEQASTFVKAQSVVFVEGGYTEKLITQCCQFPNAEHDDLVDVLAYMVYYAFYKKRGGSTIEQ